MPTCINKCHLFVLPLPLRVTKNPSATSLYHSLQTFTGKISIPQQPSSKVAILRSLQKLHCNKYVCIFVIFYYKEMSLKRRTTWRTTPPPWKMKNPRFWPAPFQKGGHLWKFPTCLKKWDFSKARSPSEHEKSEKSLSHFWKIPGSGQLPCRMGEGLDMRGIGYENINIYLFTSLHINMNFVA